MAKKPNKDLMVGIDIGTSKVVAIVGEVNSDGKLNIVGLGSHHLLSARTGLNTASLQVGLISPTGNDPGRHWQRCKHCISSLQGQRLDST